MQDIKAALQGKTLLNGIIDHDSVALTPHLKLFVVTYPQDIKDSLPNCSLFEGDGIVDGLSLWVYGNVSDQVRIARHAVGTNLPVITGAYIYNSGAKWSIKPDTFYELLNQSIDLYDRAEIEGFFLFAGSILEQMNRTMWERWDIPSHLENTYFPYLGTATVTVVDGSTRQPVPNATAVVLYMGQVHVTRKVTNELGQFSFGGWVGKAEPSVHSATVVAQGYETLSKARVEVQARKTVSTTLVLVQRKAFRMIKNDDPASLRPLRAAIKLLLAPAGSVPLNTPLATAMGLRWQPPQLRAEPAVVDSGGEVQLFQAGMHRDQQVHDEFWLSARRGLKLDDAMGRRPRASRTTRLRDLSHIPTLPHTAPVDTAVARQIHAHLAARGSALRENAGEIIPRCINVLFHPCCSV